MPGTYVSDAKNSYYLCNGCLALVSVLIGYKFCFILLILFVTLYGAQRKFEVYLSYLPGFEVLRYMYLEAKIVLVTKSNVD